MGEEGTMTKGGVCSVPVADDLMLKMVKEQGYVPIRCYLDGKLVFALQTAGKDPCDGCGARRVICGGRKRKND